MLVLISPFSEAILPNDTHTICACVLLKNKIQMNKFEDLIGFIQ